MKEKIIQIKYFDEEMKEKFPITMQKNGDWVDLRAACDIEIKAGSHAIIPLGVGMKLPEGYEAHIAPRSSTFKNYGILQTNSVGVIDNSYSGDEDM